MDACMDSPKGHKGGSEMEAGVSRPFCWDPNSGPLQEWKVLLNAQSPLQPLPGDLSLQILNSMRLFICLFVWFGFKSYEAGQGPGNMLGLHQENGGWKCGLYVTKFYCVHIQNCQE